MIAGYVGVKKNAVSLSGAKSKDLRISFTYAVK